MARKVTSSEVWRESHLDGTNAKLQIDNVSNLQGGKGKKTLVLQYTAGKSLVEHLCKHKTSSSALSGLQRNVSSEQALNQLCLALRGALC